MSGAHEQASALARLRNRYGLSVVAANAVALMLASWTPGDDMIRTGILSGHAEHLIAYALSGAVMYVMLAPRFAAASIIAAIVAYAGLLELGQVFVPGRHAAVADFLFSATGAVVGQRLQARASTFAPFPSSDRCRLPFSRRRQTGGR